MTDYLFTIYYDQLIYYPRLKIDENKISLISIFVNLKCVVMF